MPGDYFAAGIIHRVSGGFDELLLVDTTPLDERKNWIQSKFPGGTNEGHLEDLNVYFTLAREMLEETGLVVPNLQEITLIHSESPSDSHFKNFYWIEFEKCKGGLRSTASTGTRSRVSSPYWKRVDHIPRILHTSHQQALMKVMARLEYQQQRVAS